MADQLIKSVADFNARLEALRRETARFTPKAVPHPTDPNELLDYSTAGMYIDLAKFHLDESLPNGQPQRTAVAIECLGYGLKELLRWAEANGFRNV